MFKKIKKEKFQIEIDTFLTKLPTFEIEMYNYNLGVMVYDSKVVKPYLGQVTGYNGCSMVELFKNSDLETIVHESVHIKQNIETYWGTTFDKETEAIVVSKLSTFLYDFIQKEKKRKIKKITKTPKTKEVV